MKKSKKPPLAAKASNYLDNMTSKISAAERATTKGAVANAEQIQSILETEDTKEISKKIGELAKISPQDIEVMKRQKRGQLRIGDIVLLQFKKHVNLDAEELKRKEIAIKAM